MATRRHATRRRAFAFGILGSGLLHGSWLLCLKLSGLLPPVDFELQLPPSVELGLVDTPPAPPPAPTPAGGPPAAHEAAPGASDASQAPKPERPAARPQATSQEPQPLSSYAPAGAQIVLRLNVGRLRATELAPEVGALLAAIPDWRSILGGSELDPLRDLERLYLASPDLRRSRLVIAGEYHGEEDVPRRAVARLSRARGRKPRWRSLAGVSVAAWDNADPTERVVALIGPHRFVITRSDDLTRVLRIARVRIDRATSDTLRGRDAEPRGEDALLGLAASELLGLEVHAVPRFVRGNPQGIPEQLEIKLRPRSGSSIQVRADGEFKDEPAAERAKQYWERQRDRFAANPLVAFTGLRSLFTELEVKQERKRLHLTTTVTTQQARVVLGLVQGAVAPPPAEP